MDGWSRTRTRWVMRDYEWCNDGYWPRMRPQHGATLARGTLAARATPLHAVADVMG